MIHKKIINFCIATLLFSDSTAYSSDQKTDQKNIFEFERFGVNANGIGVFLKFKFENTKDGLVPDPNNAYDYNLEQVTFMIVKKNAYERSRQYRLNRSVHRQCLNFLFCCWKK